MLRFTLFGLYEYSDHTLFDNIQLYSEFDKNVLIDTLLEECGDLKLYYQVPERAKHQIESFFKRNYENFKRMYDALYSDYNPIENYNRYEDISHTNGGEDNTTGDSTGKVSAYNVSDFSNANKSDSSNKIEYGGTHTEDNHIHGNIGVTTSQQMIESELELRKFDIYLEIIRRFENKCLVQIY